MGYTLPQISGILLKADRTMYKIGLVAYDDMFNSLDEALEYNRDIIYIYKIAVEYGDDLYLGDVTLDTLVEKLGAKISIYDYGQLNPVYSDATIVNYILQKGSVLNDLDDVTITNLQDSQILRYSASLGQWVNVGPNAAIRSSQAFTATLNQTVFVTTSPFTAPLLDVYLNGVRLNSSSYSTFGNYTITLYDGSLADDIIDVTIYDPQTSILDMIGYVKYVGATANVNLGEFGLTAGQITLDTSPTGTAGVGVMRWNDTDGTVDIGLKGGNVTLQVGQEQVMRVVNKTGADLLESEYKAVRIRLVSEGGSQGQRLAVVLAQGDNDPDSATTVGLVTETIANNQEGFITTSGIVRGINTTGSLQGETWMDGDILYLSPTVAGGLTKIKPTAPDHLLILGYVVYAHAINGKIDVNIDNGYEIGELHDVYVPTPSNNDGIFWNTANLRYQNNTIAGALGYTPVPTTRTLTINGTTYDLSADRSWTIPSDNIYNSNGALTSDRTVNSGGFSLTLNPVLTFGEKLTGITNKTYTNSFTGTTTTTPSAFLISNDITHTGATNYTANIKYNRTYATNTGASGSGALAVSMFNELVNLRGLTSSAMVQSRNFIQQTRDDAADVSTNANNTLEGVGVFQTHWQTAGSTIYTGNIWGFNSQINIRSGSVGTSIGTRSSILIGQFTSNITLITNHYAFLSVGTIGTTSGPTATITNYYGLYIDTPTVGATGTITNRWGVYAPDVAMRHYLNGNLLLGTTTDAGYKLDVNGTARVSGNVTFGGEVFGPTYFNGPTVNTGTLNIRYASVSLPTTYASILSTEELTVSGGNTVSTITGNGVVSFRINNSASASTWYFENKRNAVAGSLEISNDIGSPTLTLFPSR